MQQQRFRADRLRRAREAAGLSRERAAVEVGRGYQSLTAYESGRVRPPVDVLAGLAALYGVSVDSFLDVEAVV